MKAPEGERDKENSCPNPKRARLSLSLKKKPASDRFASVSSDELEGMAKYRMPKNSAVSSRWAMKNFREWYEEHNLKNPSNVCPEEVMLPSCSKDILNRWLCVYVTETRNHNGDSYPPKTINALLCGILREMRVQKPDYPNFLEKTDTDFSSFHATLDNLFKSLRSRGVGASSSRTEGISPDEEKLLWLSGAINLTTPKGLINATFYYVGKCFCLRGGSEHRSLCQSQLERLYQPDRYIFRENSSKNKPGGINQLKMEHKCVTILANPGVGERCPVHIIDLYMSKLPRKAKELDLFYCRPLPTVPEKCDDPWFTAVAIGKNTFSSMLKDMCQQAGIGGTKTNHSLRVTGATNLFAAGVPERVIQNRTGHVSLEALRKYERVTDQQEMAISKILSGEMDSYNDAITGLEPESTVTVPKSCVKVVSSSSTVCSLSSISTASATVCSTTDSTNCAPPNPGSSGIQYNNCTVNVYGATAPPAPPPAPAPVSNFPYYPPFYPWPNMPYSYDYPQ